MSQRFVPSLVLLISALLLTACATPAAPISEEQRCTRYGGLWQLGSCRVPGGGGGGGGGGSM